MRAAGKVGVGQVVIRTTHHLAAVVPSGEVLMMITMRYVNQIREHKEFDFPSTSAKSTGVTAKEMELARKLIDDMAGPWKPEEFEDTYNEDLMHRIEEKVKAGETQGADEAGEREGRAARREGHRPDGAAEAEHRQSRRARPQDRQRRRQARRVGHEGHRCAEGARARKALSRAQSRPKHKPAARRKRA